MSCAKQKRIRDWLYYIWFRGTDEIALAKMRNCSSTKGGEGMNGQSNDVSNFNWAFIEGLLRRHFFIAPSHELPGGVADLFDYGTTNVQKMMISLWAGNSMLSSIKECSNYKHHVLLLLRYWKLLVMLTNSVVYYCWLVSFGRREILAFGYVYNRLFTVTILYINMFSIPKSNYPDFVNLCTETQYKLSPWQPPIKHHFGYTGHYEHNYKSSF